MSATRTTALRGLALLGAAVLALGACSFTGLAFYEDRRLSFVSPEDREEVTLPVTIDWEIRDFEIIEPAEQPRPAQTPSGEAEPDPDRGFFAVFVDQTPQPPGEPLAWFARDDETCERNPNCPDESYLASRGAHTTSDTQFTIDVLPQPSEENRREIHEVTVVLLDPDGLRISESAWTIEFEVDRNQDT